jgi:hypothetical protein
MNIRVIVIRNLEFSKPATSLLPGHGHSEFGFQHCDITYLLLSLLLLAKLVAPHKVNTDTAAPLLLLVTGDCRQWYLLPSSSR